MRHVVLFLLVISFSLSADGLQVLEDFISHPYHKPTAASGPASHIKREALEDDKCPIAHLYSLVKKLEEQRGSELTSIENSQVQLLVCCLFD